jgi:sugar lactone lactonase YvrE
MKITRRFALLSGIATLGLPAMANAHRAVAPSPRSDPGAILGEGPLWSARDNTLYWDDIRGKKLHAFSLDQKNPSGSDSWGGHSWDMPDLIDWIVLRQSGGFVVGILRTVHALTLEPFKLTPLFEIEADKADNRLNDAKVDAKGRLWTGTMHMPFSQKTAALYRIDADLSVHQMDAPYLCTNGPAFSRDGTRMYHNETSEGLVYVFDVATDGALSGKRIFTRFAEGVGSPDGLTVDADDGIWVAHYGGSRISRYKPDGKLDFDIRIPAKQVTSMTFAGAALDRLFVTTAAQPPVDADDPQAGTLFEVPALLLRGHRGLPTNAFAG